MIIRTAHAGVAQPHVPKRNAGTTRALSVHLASGHGHRQTRLDKLDRPGLQDLHVRDHLEAGDLG
jgi:hypothetical protein